MTVINMQDSNVNEIIHMFKVMNDYSIPCSLEMNPHDSSDPLVSITGELVSVEYIETADFENRGDTIVIHLGGANFAFNLADVKFSKDITDCQITVAVVAKECAAWFSSSHIPATGIEAAKAYKPTGDSKIVLEVDEHEAALIGFIRTLNTAMKEAAANGRDINTLYLADMAEIKSKLLNIISQLETPNQCTKEEAADDLRKAACLLMELECSMQESFSNKTLSKTKNRPNSAFLAGRS